MKPCCFPALLLALVLAVPISAAEPAPRRDAVVNVVERVMPCVVNIATEEIVERRDAFSEMLQEFWGPHYRLRPRTTRYSLGSGVIVDEEGYVLTNLHVVQRASIIWVQLADGREFEAKVLIGTSRRDVALVRLMAPEGTRFKSVQFGLDDDLLLGETVLALGNPFGLGGSVSRGILSSKNRRPPLENETLQIEDWLQTDAAINPGSSGGPLINLEGDLIGLNVAVHREGQGIGFAIPIKQVHQALADIVTPEARDTNWFGARFQHHADGLRVLSVEPGSPAAQAGLRTNDIVTTINGKTPRGVIHAVALLGADKKREAQLRLQRSGDRRSITVKLRPLGELLQQRLGLTLQEMDDDLAAQFGIRARQGLLVAEVEPGSPAAGARLQPGNIILGLADQATPDLLSAASALAGRPAGERIDVAMITRQRRGPITQLGQATVQLRLR